MNREIKIGIFTVAMIAIAWGGIRFLSGIDLLSSNNNYYAQYPEIDGIQKASPIFVKGVKIGSVTGISLDKEDASQVELKFTIANKFKIPVDSEAKIFNNGLMGGKAIDLILGNSKEYLESGGVISSGYDADLFEVAGSEFDNIINSFNTVTSELTKTLLNINTLLESNSSNIGQTVSNLNDLSANLNKLIESNNANITSMVEDFAGVSQTLSNNSQDIDSIIRNVNALTSELSAAKLGEALSTSLSQLKTIMEKIDSDEGSAGLILRDESLYRNLSSASANLDSLLYDLKQNPKRYVNVSVFGANEEKARLKAEKKAKRAER